MVFVPDSIWSGRRLIVFEFRHTMAVDIQKLISAGLPAIGGSGGKGKLGRYAQGFYIQGRDML